MSVLEETWEGDVAAVTVRLERGRTSMAYFKTRRELAGKRLVRETQDDADRNLLAASAPDLYRALAGVEYADLGNGAPECLRCCRFKGVPHKEDCPIGMALAKARGPRPACTCGHGSDSHQRKGCTAIECKCKARGDL